MRNLSETERSALIALRERLECEVRETCNRLMTAELAPARIKAELTQVQRYVAALDSVLDSQPPFYEER